LYLPAASAAEAALVPGVDVFGAADLPSLYAHLAGDADARLSPVAAPPLCTDESAAVPDMADVSGQRGARRALEVAAAGGHHVLIIGRTRSNRHIWFGIGRADTICSQGQLNPIHLRAIAELARIFREMRSESRQDLDCGV
jgi:magnesium chelatase subunit ChlI-like protein